MFPEAQTKQLVAVLVITNVVLISTFAGVYYLLSTRATETSRISGRIESIRNQNQREQRINKLVKSTAETRRALNKYFVQPNNSASFITKIENIASETRVDLQISNVSIEPVDTGSSGEQATDDNQEKSLFERLALDLQASGSWERVIHFVRVLELLPQKTRLSKVSFNQSGQSGPNDSTPPWSVTLTISVVKLTAS